jgi:hypothetical protein
MVLMVSDCHFLTHNSSLIRLGVIPVPGGGLFSVEDLVYPLFYCCLHNARCAFLENNF